VLTGVGVDVSKFFGVGAGVLKRGARAESESEKCDSAQLWFGIKMLTEIILFYDLTLPYDANDIVVFLLEAQT